LAAAFCPIATVAAPEALALMPNANALPPEAAAVCPMATAPLSEALAPVPSATELLPCAEVRTPPEVDPPIATPPLFATAEVLVTRSVGFVPIAILLVSAAAEPPPLEY
jgi:hypothetical protein